MTRALLFTLLWTTAFAEDEVHPRTPGQALVIEFEPYSCSRCVAEKKQKAPARLVTLMRQPPGKVARLCGLKKDWIVIASPHFRLFSNMRAAKVKRNDSRFIEADMERMKAIFPTLTFAGQAKALTPHQRAHLYHIRLERVYAHFSALTGNAKPFLGMGAAYEIYLFAGVAEYRTFTDRFYGRSTRVGVRHHVREDPNFLSFATAERLVEGGDVSFSNNVIHNAVHLLTDGYRDFYRDAWGWLEEGIAHYYERRETPRFNTFCWTEGREAAMFGKERWRRTVLTMVKAGRDLPLDQWCEKLQPGELTELEQGLSWSIVEWLIESSPVRFGALMDKLQDYKNKPTSAQAIKFVFGMSPGALHLKWREHVLATYPKLIR